MVLKEDQARNIQKSLAAMILTYILNLAKSHTTPKPHILKAF